MLAEKHRNVEDDSNIDRRQLCFCSTAIDDPRGFLASFPDGGILDEIQRAPRPKHLAKLFCNSGIVFSFIDLSFRLIDFANFFYTIYL